jgi:pimeloyl-ACP methyl ester carboxylesterase
METVDHWIDDPQGRLFARTWRPDRAGTQASATILLFHDSLGCVELWRDFPKQLARATQLQVVAYDRLGFGRSDPCPGALAADFMQTEALRSVPALCAQLGLSTLIPFGHSVGGAMAVATAVHLPERCTAVVTMSAQAFVEDRTLAGIQEAQRTFKDPGQVERLARYHGDKARWVLSAWIETWLASSFATWTLDADLACVRCPLLALHGDRDEYGSGRHPKRIGARAAGPTGENGESGHEFAPKARGKRLGRNEAERLAPAYSQGWDRPAREGFCSSSLACQPPPPRPASEVQLAAQLVAEQPLRVQRRLEGLHTLPEHRGG